MRSVGQAGSESIGTSKKNMCSILDSILFKRMTLKIGFSNEEKSTHQNAKTNDRPCSYLHPVQVYPVSFRVLGRAL